MREIKFRAWSPTANRMMSWEIVQFMSADLLLQSTAGNIPMQFTGITNNGQKWYEGDILECDSDWYQITWDDDQAQWEATGINSTGESIGLCELISSESWVQGNIYQNPELLT